MIQTDLHTPWAILPSVFEQMVSNELEDLLDSETRRHRVGAALNRQSVAAASVDYSAPQSIQVLSLSGVLTQHPNTFLEAFGFGMSTTSFAAQFKRAMADPHVGRVIIAAHTPGGQVWGTQELSDLIYSYRGTKPVTTVVNSLLASAGVWIASAADEVVITPGGEIGSIGVMKIHTDDSKANEKRGRTTTVIAEPPGKAQAAGVGPLSEEVLATEQESVRETYGRFVDSLARNYGVTTKHVRDNFGQGGMLKAKQAVEAGMAHRIATLDQVIAEGVKRRRISGSVRAANLLRLAEAE